MHVAATCGWRSDVHNRADQAACSRRWHQHPCPRGQPAPGVLELAGSRQPSGGRTVSHFSFSSCCYHYSKGTYLNHVTGLSLVQENHVPPRAPLRGPAVLCGQAQSVELTRGPHISQDTRALLFWMSHFRHRGAPSTLGLLPHGEPCPWSALTSQGSWATIHS